MIDHDEWSGCRGVPAHSCPRGPSAGNPRTTSSASRKSGTRSKVEALENSTDRLNVSQRRE
jgi:hypothetical protein